jgi:hypothetical protein
MSPPRWDLDELRVYHRIRVVHGGTGRPYAGIEAALTDPVWPHWLLRVRGADVVLATHDRFAADRPANTPVELHVTDLLLLERFANNGVAAITLRRNLDTDVTLTLTPTLVTLEVELVNRLGAAHTGLTVAAESTGGFNVPLPEVTPGIYRSAAAMWPPALQPFRITDGVGAVLSQPGQVAIDYTRPVTRVRQIAP